MQEYYELELPPNSDIYKGEINTETNELTGFALYFNRKSKLLLCGNTVKG